MMNVQESETLINSESFQDNISKVSNIGVLFC